MIRDVFTFGKELCLIGANECGFHVDSVKGFMTLDLSRLFIGGYRANFYLVLTVKTVLSFFHFLERFLMIFDVGDYSLLCKNRFFMAR